MKTLPQARFDCAWTQKDLALEIGVTPRSLRRWEAGQQRPHVKYHRRLATVLGRTLEQLQRILDTTLTQAAQSAPPRRSRSTIVPQ